MVLMSSFFVCIKMTLLLFYKRLFLCSSPALRIFWWTNIGYIGLWFFGSTSFYVFQCRPVQWYFLQYYNKYKHPVPGDVHGQCDATTVVHVAMPMVFSLVSDVALLVLPLWAISKLRVDRKKRFGLMAVFGIGLVACLLELARILALIIDTDDKTDPSCKPPSTSPYALCSIRRQVHAMSRLCLLGLHRGRGSVLDPDSR
jgi:hypothetical protein